MMGVMISVNLKKRVTQLEQTIQFIHKTETYIRFQQIHLINLYKIMSIDFPALKFIDHCYKFLKSGMAYDQSIEESLSNRANISTLVPEDVKVIQSFLHSLGASDLEGQIDHCNLHKKLLEENLTKAQKISSEKGKLYSTLGFFAGLSIAIFLF